MCYEPRSWTTRLAMDYNTLTTSDFIVFLPYALEGIRVPLVGTSCPSLVISFIWVWKQVEDESVEDNWDKYISGDGKFVGAPSTKYGVEDGV